MVWSERPGSTELGDLYVTKHVRRSMTDLYPGFWESRQHARDGGRGPWHAKARAAATVWYESIVFKTYVLTIADDIESWVISDLEERRS